MPIGGRRMGRPGLLGTMARTAVVAGTANAVVGGMNRRQSARDEQAAEAAAYRAQQAPPAAPPPAPAAPAAPAASPEDDRIAQLERLATLHDQGILSDAELASEKARILGG
jgi:hypothetical protein